MQGRELKKQRKRSSAVAPSRRQMVVKAEAFANVLAKRFSSCHPFSISVKRFSVKRFSTGGNLPAMVERSSSINDVARLAGSPRRPFRMCLTGRKPVSPKLAKKVEAAVETLDYRADPVASMLRSGDAKIVAVLVPDLDNPFFTSIVSAVEQRLGKDRYEVIVASSHGDESMERSKLKAILAWRPAGLIVIPCSDEFPSRDFIEASNDSSRDRRSRDRQPHCRHGFARQRRGGSHRRSSPDRPRSQEDTDRRLFAEPRQHSSTLQRRQRGFPFHGLPDPAIVELGIDIEAGSRKLSEWFNRHSPPTAIQALTNFTTLTALVTIAERGFASRETSRWSASTITPGCARARRR